jgi:SPP1 family predicted phage head-tail adaptor
MLQSFIRRGELDREVTFIKKDLSTGASNADHIDSWVEVDTDPIVWARKRDVKGDVGIIAEQVAYSQRTVWTVDYREDLTADNRLVHSGKVYAIIAVTENGGSRERYLDVMTNLLNSEVWT